MMNFPPADTLALESSRVNTVLRALVSLPLVLPPVVAGVGLLLALGRNGLVPLGLPFTTAGAVVAAAFVSAPFFVLTAEAGFARVDPLLVDAARTLGAPPSLVWRAVMVPAILPSVRAGAA